MTQFADVVSGLTRVSHMSEPTMRRLLAAREAETCLLEYRPPNHEITRDEFFQLLDLTNQGVSPADAADMVQARTT